MGAEMWRKAAVELSDALIHITLPLLADNLDVKSSCPSPNIECLLISSWTLFHVFLVDFQLGRCAVGKSFCRNYQKKLSSTAQRPRLLLVNYTLPLSSLFFATMHCHAG